MALREGTWRGHTQWVCDEHRFDTLKESTAQAHLAELHSEGDEPINEHLSAAVAAEESPAKPDPEKEGDGR